MIDRSLVIDCSKWLLSKGWFVQMRVSRWSGVLPPLLISEAFNYPQWKNLLSIPPQHRKVFRRLEKKCWDCFHSYTHSTAWGLYLPETAYEGLNEEYIPLKALFDQERDQIVSQYENLYQNALAVGRIIGQKEWEALNPPGSIATESFLQEWGERVWNTVPKKNELYNSFGCKAIEYRLLRDLTSDECEQFVSEVSDSFYQQTLKICLAMHDEYKRYRTFQAHHLSGFKKKVEKLSKVWCFRDQTVERLLNEFVTVTNSENAEAIIEQSKNLMEYVVPKFSQGRLDGATEGIKYEQ